MITFSSEKDLEECLMGHTELLAQVLSFDVEKTLFSSQVSIPPYGIVDILAMQKLKDAVYICVIELKNERLKAADLSQTIKYTQYFERLESPYKIFTRGILIGPKTFSTDSASNDNVYLFQNIEVVETYEFDIHPVNGMVFNLLDGWGPSGGKNEDADQRIIELMEKCQLCTTTSET